MQQLLEERALTERNWVRLFCTNLNVDCLEPHLAHHMFVQLEEWWEQFAYLQPRYPTAVNINWQGVMPGTWGALPVGQPEAAAMFTRHILHFRESIVK